MKTVIVLISLMALMERGFGFPAENDFIEKSPEELGNHFEGDMQLTPQQIMDLNKRNGVLDQRYRWLKNGQRVHVFYAFQSGSSYSKINHLFLNSIYLKQFFSQPQQNFKWFKMHWTKFKAKLASLSSDEHQRKILSTFTPETVVHLTLVELVAVKICRSWETVASTMESSFMSLCTRLGSIICNQVMIAITMCEFFTRTLKLEENTTSTNTPVIKCRILEQAMISTRLCIIELMPFRATVIVTQSKLSTLKTWIELDKENEWAMVTLDESITCTADKLLVHFIILFNSTKLS